MGVLCTTTAAQVIKQRFSEVQQIVSDDGQNGSPWNIIRAASSIYQIQVQELGSANVCLEVRTV